MAENNTKKLYICLGCGDAAEVKVLAVFAKETEKTYAVCKEDIEKNTFLPKTRFLKAEMGQFHAQGKFCCDTSHDSAIQGFVDGQKLVVEKANTVLQKERLWLRAALKANRSQVKE